MLRLWNRKDLAHFSTVASVTLVPKSFINLRTNLESNHSRWSDVKGNANIQNGVSKPRKKANIFYGWSLA